MNEMSKLYKENLIETINTLVQCESMIFSSAVNLLMNGELKEIDKVFEVGEIYEFNINHFETSTDINIQYLTKVLKSVKNTIESLQNINAINDDEVDWE
jgi:hypothetical protein